MGGRLRQWALPPARAVGHGIQFRGGAQRRPGLALDAQNGAGVRIDHNHDRLSGKLVRDLKAFAVERHGAITTHMARDAMQEQFIQPRSQCAELSDAWQVLLVA